ncbi:MAG: hypothetical protein JW936_02915 [Sedimentisphaerales bacterium]|nr:hypothetical protein [Sedimentisphaerales bacterium]
MPNQHAYFAHGHPSQHDAYQWLFAPTGAESDLHALFEFSDIFGDTGGAREDAACPSIGSLFAGFNLHNSVIAYVAQRRALLIRRPELLSRGGFLREGIIQPTTTPSPVLRYIAALAPKPTIEQIEQTARKFSAQLNQLQSVQPLLQLFAPDAPNLAALKPVAARAIAAFADSSPEKHICFILPPENTNLILPLALAIDEILPDFNRQRGFVLCTGPVTAFNTQVAQKLDFSLFAADPRRNIPAPSEDITVCDLRLRPKHQPPLVDNLLQLFSQDPQAVAAFAQWIQKRLSQQGFSQLTDLFWQRFALRSNTRPFTIQQFLQTLNTTPLETLDRKSFLNIFQSVAGQPQNSPARQQIINALKPTIQKQPALVTWLFDPTVIQHKDLLPEITKIIQDLHQSPP